MSKPSGDWTCGLAGDMALHKRRGAAYHLVPPYIYIYIPISLISKLFLQVAVRLVAMSLFYLLSLCLFTPLYSTLPPSQSQHKNSLQYRYDRYESTYVVSLLVL
ncbi:hypothetical protein VN97_g6746 [Penicillium thymicola]|uniref:Uncharacterized protein n=1 Tax=Penicillium thymicola TaxID=293382 RepID=A0AAI9X776_PENTH|nr:hypothetical protein VN97_g6746 [Penicillium thymicola]